MWNSFHSCWVSHLFISLLYSFHQQLPCLWFNYNGRKDAAWNLGCLSCRTKQHIYSGGNCSLLTTLLESGVWPFSFYWKNRQVVIKETTLWPKAIVETWHMAKLFKNKNPVYYTLQKCRRPIFTSKWTGFFRSSWMEICQVAWCKLCTSQNAPVIRTSMMQEKIETWNSCTASRTSAWACESCNLHWTNDNFYLK